VNVLQNAVLRDEMITQTLNLHSSHRLSQETHEVPGAGAARVSTLIASELIDEDTGIAVIISRADAAGAWARSDRRAVGLHRVLEDTVLNIRHMNISEPFS
jgi:hypothetical protein